MAREKVVQTGALNLRVKSHTRKYKNADAVQNTPIYSAQSPFDESRFRLKSIIPAKFAKLFTDRIYFMVCDKYPVFVDIWSGQRVLEIVPQVDPLIDISHTFEQIDEKEYAAIWKDMEIIGFEKRIMPNANGDSLDWTLFYTDTAMTTGIAQCGESPNSNENGESSHMLYAKF